MMTIAIGERAMPERTDWEAKARGLIRGEIARQGVTYAQLVERLRNRSFRGRTQPSEQSQPRKVYGGLRANMHEGAGSERDRLD